MKYKVVLTDRAAGELDDSTEWYIQRSGSDEVGRRWHEGFVALIERLCDSPDRHPLAPESDLFPFELREVHYGSGRRKIHRVLFRIVDQAVEVLSVRHAAQRDFTPEDL